MKPFDYVSVLLSFVVSLIIGQVLIGVSHLIQSGVKRVSIPLLYWIVLVLFLCVDYWFSIWGLRDTVRWSFGYVSLLLLFAALLFLVARAIVPDHSSPEPIDLSALYDRDRRRIMVLFFIYWACGTTINLTLPGFATSELLAICIALMTLFAIAWKWRSPYVQHAVVVLNFLLTAYYAARYEPLL